MTLINGLLPTQITYRFVIPKTLISYLITVTGSVTRMASRNHQGRNHHCGHWGTVPSDFLSTEYGPQWGPAISLMICNLKCKTNSETPILVMLTFLHAYLDLDQRSNFEIDFIMLKLAYFDAFWWEKHDGVKTFALSLIGSKLFWKKVLWRKWPLANYILPMNQKYWPSVKIDDVIRKTTPRAFDSWF